MFGAPYILGQKEGDLKLVYNLPHTELTKMLCRGKNIIYALVHCSHVAAPGFNTIIFGLSWRGAGFGYHCDQKSDLYAKNITMTPYQPVCTTVFYQEVEDSGKETCLWIPTDNYDNNTYENPYKARNALETTHGMCHVQRAGLQAKAKVGSVSIISIYIHTLLLYTNMLIT